MHFHDIALKRKGNFTLFNGELHYYKKPYFVLMVKYMRTWYKHVHTVDSSKRTTSLAIFPKAE